MSSDAKRKANAKYDAKTPKILLRMNETQKAAIQAAAAGSGMSVNAYILAAVADKVGAAWPVGGGRDDETKK